MEQSYAEELVTAARKAHLEGLVAQLRWECRRLDVPVPVDEDALAIVRLIVKSNASGYGITIGDVARCMAPLAA
jgi:hypothetical protein